MASQYNYTSEKLKPINKDAWWNMIAAVYNFLSASTALAQALDNKYVLQQKQFEKIIPNKPLVQEGAEEIEVNLIDFPFFIELLSDEPELTEVSPNRIVDETIVQICRIVSTPKIYTEDYINSPSCTEIVKNTTKVDSLGDYSIVTKALTSMHRIEDTIQEKNQDEYEAQLLDLLSKKPLIIKESITDLYNNKNEMEKMIREEKVHSNISIDNSTVSQESTACDLTESDNYSAGMDTIDTIDPKSIESISIDLENDPTIDIKNNLEKILNCNTQTNDSLSSYTLTNPNYSKNVYKRNDRQTRRYNATLKSQIMKTPLIQKELIDYSNEESPTNVPNTIEALKRQLSVISQYEGKGTNKRQVYDHIMKISAMVTKLELEQQDRISAKSPTVSNLLINSTPIENNEDKQSIHSTKLGVQKLQEPSPNLLKDTSKPINETTRVIYLDNTIEKSIKRITIENIKNGKGTLRIEKVDPPKKKSKKAHISKTDSKIKLVKDLIDKTAQQHLKFKPITSVVKNGVKYITIDTEKQPLKEDFTRRQDIRKRTLTPKRSITPQKMEEFRRKPPITESNLKRKNIELSEKEIIKLIQNLASSDENKCESQCCTKSINTSRRR